MRLGGRGLVVGDGGRAGQALLLLVDRLVIAGRQGFVTLGHPPRLVQEFAHQRLGHGRPGLRQIAHVRIQRALRLRAAGGNRRRPLIGATRGTGWLGRRQDGAGRGRPGRAVAQLEAVARLFDALLGQQPRHRLIQLAQFLREARGQMAHPVRAPLGLHRLLVQQGQQRLAQHVGPQRVQVGPHHGQAQCGAHQ